MTAWFLPLVLIKFLGLRCGNVVNLKSKPGRLIYERSTWQAGKRKRTSVNFSSRMRTSQVIVLFIGQNRSVCRATDYLCVCVCVCVCVCACVCGRICANNQRAAQTTKGPASKNHWNYVAVDYCQGFLHLLASERSMQDSLARVAKLKVLESFFAKSPERGS